VRGGEREREGERGREREREGEREKEQKVWACSKRSSFSQSVSQSAFVIIILIYTIISMNEKGGGVCNWSKHKIYLSSFYL
jgi:hypothetical protein